MKNSILITVIVAIAVGAIAFFGGMQYQKMQRSTNATQFNRQGGFGQGGRINGPGGNGANRPVVGQIINLDDKSITVKLMDGSSKIVLLPDNVAVTKTDSGSKTDLKTGENVGVFGASNSDGSVTAQNIQLNPMFRGFGGLPRPSGLSSNQPNANGQ